MQVQTYTRACPVCKAGVEVDKVSAGRRCVPAARRARAMRALLCCCVFKAPKTHRNIIANKPTIVIVIVVIK